MQNYTNLIKLLITLLIVSACTNETKEQTFITETPVEVIERVTPKVVLEADIQVKEDIPFSYDLTALFEVNPDSYTYSVKTGPLWLYIENNELKGTPINRPVSGVEEIVVMAKNDFDNTEIEATISLGINGDPLRTHAWHLKNYGQKTFSSTKGVFGYDANVTPLYANYVFGNGVKIAVSDSGVETTHPDLMDNMLAGEHRNYTLSNPYNQTPTTSESHGTAVSGIIAAVGFNNIGTTGVAPKAKIAGFQFLESSQSTEIMIDQASGDFDIFNYSYGDVNYFDVSSDSDYLDHLRYMVKNGRNGKGAFYVKSAGNELIQVDNYDNINLCVSHNANFPMENESPFMLVVGAVNAKGKRSSYSSSGSNLWVSAPGGEFGANEPAIITTDLSTCLKGYSKASRALNEFEYGHELNKNCEYTSTMNGTSSAAPIVSGVIALMLDANPNLSWRDVKHILAMTSKKIDTNSNAWPSAKKHPSTGLSGCPNIELSGHNYELGWTENAVGIKHNNFYGFGLVDAVAAVNMAKDFSLDPMGWLPLPDFIETDRNFNTQRLPFSYIPNNSSRGLSDSRTVSNDIKVETVQVKVSVSHSLSGELGIELTSPSGTKSILMNVNNSFLLSNDKNLNIVLASQAFYGEDAKGTWRLKVIDGNSRNNSTGMLVSWSINILGHN